MKPFLKHKKPLVFLLLCGLFGMLFIGSVISRSSRQTKKYGYVDTWSVSLAGNGDVDSSESSSSSSLSS